MGTIQTFANRNYKYCVISVLHYLTFLLLRQKKSNKRKGDFWRNAPRAKK